MENIAEIKRLQSCINDLISVLALPAIWSGSESSHIFDTLLDVLLTMLRLDFAYARLSDASDDPPIEVVRWGDHQHSSIQPQQFGQALGRWLAGDQTVSRSVIPVSAGEAEVSIASFSLGLQHEDGVLIAGSRRTDFPTEVERLLLRVAANQAVIGLQEARRSGEQKRIAEMLEQRVAERTRCLTAVNDELQRSEAYLAEAQRLSHTGSFGWKVSTGDINWSEETFRIFQYERTTKPTVELILQRVHPEDAAGVQQTIERASRDGKNFEHEYRLAMPDGAVKHVHVVAHAERDESGEIEFVGAVMDISDRKRAEEELRRSETLAEQRFRLVVDTTPAMINTLRPDGYLDYVNKGWLDYFGFSLETALDRADVMKMSAPSETDMNGGNLQPIIHPKDLPGFAEQWKAMLAAGKPAEGEARVRRFDGAYRWHLFRAVPVCDQTGKPIKWYASAFDIEDRKQAEKALRQSESYLAEAQRLAHTGSWVWSVPGRDSLHLSEEWYRIYGFDPKRGVPTWEERLQRIHPEDRTRRKMAIGRAVAEKAEFELEYRILLSGDRIKYIHTVGHPVLNAAGDLVQFVGSSTDITDRKRAEMLLAGEKRLLEMIATHDSRAAILDALCRLVEELSSGSLSSILLLDPNTKCLRHGAAPSLPISYTHAIDGAPTGPCAGSCGTAAYRAEPVIVSDIAADPLWVDYRDLALPHGLRACWSAPILSSEGRVLGTFATYYREARSPTPQEQHVIERITHLASIAIVGEQAEEALRQAQAEIARVSRVTTMGELTASIAHEVNQPIAAAITDANTCLRWLAGDIPNLEEAREAAMRVVKDSRRAAEIISRTRLLFKKGASERELVDINEVIREMIVLLRNEVAQYSISIRTSFAADCPRIMADRVQLQQVLMNLIMNSIDAMKDVGGMRELAIQSACTENEQLLVSVSDTGVGLPPHQADQIFNAFFTTKVHGTGMGLRISRSIVESHGGRLWTAQSSSHGATFCFTLPTRVEV
jgi:PAS domain S-box-containing protein